MSDKSVAERLQVKVSRHIAVLAASPDLDGAVGVFQARAELAEAEVVLPAVHDRAKPNKEIPKVIKAATSTAILWIAFPKLSSRLASDLSRDIIRTLAPSYGLDTVSQIAIDED